MHGVGSILALRLSLRSGVGVSIIDWIIGSLDTFYFGLYKYRFNIMKRVLKVRKRHSGVKQYSSMSFPILGFSVS